MIQDPEDLLASAGRQGVIQSGRQVQQHHGGAEHTGADNVRSAAPAHRTDHENRNGSHRQQHTETVADAVGDLFLR